MKTLWCQGKKFNPTLKSHESPKEVGPMLLTEETLLKLLQKHHINLAALLGWLC